MSEQGKTTSVPQVNQDTNRGIEQGKDMIPKHVGSPPVTEIQTPFYPDPVMKPLPRPPDKIAQNDRQINLDLDLEKKKDFEENAPYQEGVISNIYQRPDKSQLVEPPELTDLVDTDKIVQNYLPKQTDIDKILKVIQRKVLKGTHLPITIKEIQTGCLKNPYFKDLYLYLSQNKLPSSKGAICKIEIYSQIYIYIVGFITIQTEFRKGKSSISHTRRMCRSNNCLVPFKLVYRSPRCCQNVLDHSR